MAAGGGVGKSLVWNFRASLMEPVMSSYDMRFGAVFFDDVAEHSSGYFAVAGESARRLSNCRSGDLSTDVVWLTNLNYDMMRAAQMYPNARYRRTDFLGENSKNLLSRIGLYDLEDASVCKQAVEHMALIFERVMMYANKYGQFSSVPMYNLRIGFREIRKKIDPIVPPDLYNALCESENYFIAVERPVSQVMPAWMPLYLPPYEHCLAILSRPLPRLNSEWNKIPPRMLPESKDVSDWPELNSIGLAKVTLHDFLPEWNELIKFGSNPAKGRNQRRWIPFEELRFLSQISTVKIESAWIANKSYIPEDYIAIADLLNPVQRLSLSGMLFLHNLWSAPSQSYTGGIRGQLKNTCSPFIRCYDRLLCLNAARKTKLHGLEVIGYSSGKVYINCQESSADEILRVCRKVGLIPPLLDAQDMENELPIDLDDPLSLQQTLWGRGYLDQIMKFDQKCSELMQ